MATSQAATVQAQQILAIGMTVVDIERSRDFYTKAFGFQVVCDQIVDSQIYLPGAAIPPSRIRLITLKLGDEHLRLMQFLDLLGKPVPQDSRSHDQWFQHLAIVVRDLAQAYQHLQSFPFTAISAAPQTLPPDNPAAAYIQAFKFRDPDGHPLELIWFPPDKGQQKWHQPQESLFLGIDHTAVTVADTAQSLHFYQDQLGLQVEGGSLNRGETQSRLDGLAATTVRVTALRPAQGGLGIELLEYLAPTDGRPISADFQPYDIAYLQVEMRVHFGQGADASTCLIRDPSGHTLLLLPAIA